MSATVAERLTWLDKALWVVDHAVIADLPTIDDRGKVVPETTQGVPGAGRLAHEVLAETIRRSPRGCYRRGLTPRLWLALLIAAAFEGSANVTAMYALATGSLPREMQWELGILTTHPRTGKPTMLTAKQLYTMGDAIDRALDPYASDDEEDRARREAHLAAVTRALNDATLVVAPTSTSYAADESGIWAWIKGKRKPKEVPPHDEVEALTPAQRSARRKKGISDPEITDEEIAATDRLYGPTDEDVDAVPGEPAAEGTECRAVPPDAHSVAADADADTKAEPGADPAAEPESETTATVRRSCFDLFARWGAKTHKTGRTTGYFGYALHALIRVPDLYPELPTLRVNGKKTTPADSLAGPLLVEEFTVTSASTDIVDPTLAMIRRVLAKGHTFGDFLGDRHYSYKAFTRWAIVLWRMGIKPVLDMRADNHGPFDYNGATVIDGTPHCGVPEGLKLILAPGLNATAEAEKQFSVHIDQRAQYALERIATAPSNSGATRWRCPALSGSVGCPRRPLTSEVAVKNDLAIVEPPATVTPWCTADTAGIPAIKQMKYQQQHYWGSRAWRRSWNRRTYVEGCFGTMKNHRTGNIHRGFMQFTGQPLVTLAVTAAVVAQNLRELESWFVRASVLNDPERWDALRKGEKERAGQTRKRLLAYEAHPLHRTTVYTHGFTMLNPARQEALDTEQQARLSGADLAAA